MPATSCAHWRGCRSLSASPERAFRPCYRDVTDAYNCFALLRVGQAGVTALRARAKRLGVTLHDLMLALLLQALSGFAPERRHAERRSAIAVAAIVNLRSTFGAPAENAFGQFLASLALRIRYLPVSPSTSWHLQSMRPPRASSANAFTCARCSPCWAPRWRGRTWTFPSATASTPSTTRHRRASPCSTRENAGPAEAGTAAYVRAVSTGPLLPAVLAISTCGSHLSIGVSYRRTVYDATLVAALEDALRAAVLPE